MTPRVEFHLMCFINAAMRVMAASLSHFPPLIILLLYSTIIENGRFLRAANGDTRSLFFSFWSLFFGMKDNGE